MGKVTIHRFSVVLKIEGSFVFGDEVAIQRGIREGIERQMANAGLSDDESDACVTEVISVAHCGEDHS